MSTTAVDTLARITDVLADAPGIVWVKDDAKANTATIDGVSVSIVRSGRGYALTVPGTDHTVSVRTIADGKAGAAEFVASVLASQALADMPDDDETEFVPGTFDESGEFTPEESAADRMERTIDYLTEDAPGPVDDAATAAEVPTVTEAPAPAEVPATDTTAMLAQMMAMMDAQRADMAAEREAMRAELDALRTQNVPAGLAAPVADLPVIDFPAAPDMAEVAVRAAIIDDTMAAGTHPETRSAGSMYDALGGWHVNDVLAQGQEVAGEIRDLLNEFMKFPDAMARAYVGTLTLWALHTHVYLHQGVTPYMLISSPTAGAGKSTLIQILSRIVRAASIEVNPTAAVTRTLAGEGYTLLLDEVDELYTGKDFKSILNSGYKRGGAVSRIKGKSVQRDIVFSPKLMAGIGREGTPIEGALLDRCVQIWLERAMPGERPYFADDMISEGLRERIVRWSRNAVAGLARFPQDMPALESSRALEIWGPLISVADSIGWGAEAREWAAQIESRKEVQADPNVQILTDTREALREWIAANPYETRIKNTDLLDLRNILPARQFTERLSIVSYGKRLGRFGIKTIPDAGARYFKVGDGNGGFAPDVERVFDRYCTEAKETDSE
jgi:Protein of unknown function (DUF3631)